MEDLASNQKQTLELETRLAGMEYRDEKFPQVQRQHSELKTHLRSLNKRSKRVRGELEQTSAHLSDQIDQVDR